MAFDTITGAANSTATTFGGDALNKVGNLLNGSAAQTANIYHSALNVVDATDSTKKLSFNVASLSTAQTVVASAKNNNAINLGCVGTHEIYIPAGSMYTRTTNGAAYTARETTTNKVMISSFNFDTTTSENSQFNWSTPANWDAGTIRYKVYWTCTGGSSTQTISLNLAGRAFSDDDALDTAFGTAIAVTDTYIADNDVHVTSYSTAVTIAGSPVAGDNVVFQLNRDVAADNLGVDCEVLGILLEVSTNKSNSS